MRGRGWRRIIKENIVIRRLSWRLRNSHWCFIDANNIIRQSVRFEHYIGTETEFRAKSHVTTKWDKNYKIKFSPNKSKCGWRYKGHNRTREECDKEFLNILKEHGIR